MKGGNEMEGRMKLLKVPSGLAIYNEGQKEVSFTSKSKCFVLIDEEGHQTPIGDSALRILSYGDGSKLSPERIPYGKVCFVRWNCQEFPNKIKKLQA